MEVRFIFPEIVSMQDAPGAGEFRGTDKWVTPAHNPASDYELFGMGTEATPKNAIVGVPTYEIAQRIAAMRGRTAYVYLGIYQGPDALYAKVGVSNHPEKRQESGKSYCPFERRALWIVETRYRALAFKLEGIILEKYRSASTRGEWLRLADERAVQAFVDGATCLAEMLGLKPFSAATIQSPAP